MKILIYFLFFTLTSTNKCSFQTNIQYEQIYLCRQKLNSTSVRIWLHLKLNQTNQYELHFFSYYVFTLRILDIIEGHKIHLKDRFEKRISEYVKINITEKENHTINIHNLPSGRYEICANFVHKKMKKFYYRSSNSCLHIPWNVPEYEREQPNLFMHVLFMVLIIILLVAIAFVIYSIHRDFKRRQSIVLVDVEHEDLDQTEHAKLLVNRHFPEEIHPLELLVRKRIHERYAH